MNEAKKIAHSAPATRQPGTNVKVQKLGCLNLQRTVIVNNATRCVFYIDEDSFSRLASSALALKMTPDELLRQFVWLFTGDETIKKEVILRLATSSH